jgi:hypothetical protein
MRSTMPIGASIDFEQFTPYVRDLSKKQAVTSESLEKIENGNPPYATCISHYTNYVQLRMRSQSADANMTCR